MKNEARYIRIAIMISIAFLILLMAPAAPAEEGVINPNQAKVWEIERIAKSKRKKPVSENGVSVSNDSLDPIAFTTITAPALDGAGTWQLTYNSQYYGTPISTLIYLSMKDYSDNYSMVYYAEYDSFPSVVSSCTIVTGGEYEFSVWVKSTTSGAGYYAGFFYFTIPDDSAHTSLTEKVSEVVAGCRACTQWETALNLHNWIVNNVYYDLNYNYYGADMILRGYGVCDGYSKAYLMLCRQAGIPVYRVTNYNHAWNALLLDGDWYYIDCTWDDPAGDSVPVSGWEGHTYFCLNADLLALNHPTPWEWTDTYMRTCTALDDNYYVRMNDWNGIGNRYYDENTYTWTSYSNAIINQIAANNGGNFIPFNSTDTHRYTISYPLDGNIIRDWTLLAYAMSKQSMYIPGFGSIVINVVMSEKDRCFIYSIKGYQIEETGSFTLPARLSVIDEETFVNTRASTVIIPDGCVRIGRNAFSGSNVHHVYIPNSVTSIDDTAFSGCGSMIIFCDNYSAASTFARNKGILWHYP